MWIAKSKYNGNTYGIPYDSIYDCQKYIDTKLKGISQLHRYFRAKKIFKLRYNRKPIEDIEKDNKLYFEDKIRLSFIEFNLCNGILCYNIEQHRFCEGMDF